MKATRIYFFKFSVTAAAFQLIEYFTGSFQDDITGFTDKNIKHSAVASIFM